MEDLDPKIDGENLVFSKDQIEYLRSEFERQRQWVNLLSTREQAALEELEETKSSISYKVGRFLTYVPRKILPKKSKSKKRRKDRRPLPSVFLRRKTLECLHSNIILTQMMKPFHFYKIMIR